MEYFGKGLYLIFFALVFWFIHRAQGRGLGRLVEDNHRAHERVHHTLEEHPQGRHMATIQAVDGGRNMSLETNTLGAGCFWCVEAVYQELRGDRQRGLWVYGRRVGKTYIRGRLQRSDWATPRSYNCNSIPRSLALTDVLYIFWRTHDPTTLNRQGADHGTQYRSVIFYHSPEQFETATTFQGCHGRE